MQVEGELWLVEGWARDYNTRIWLVVGSGCQLLAHLQDQPHGPRHVLHLQRPRRGEDLPRLPGDDDDDATENDDNDDTQFSRSVASLQKQNVFDSFEYPSPLPPGFHTDEEPSPETGWCTVIIVKILYLVTKNICTQGRTAGWPWLSTPTRTSSRPARCGTTLRGSWR